MRFCALSELRRAGRVTRWVDELRDELTALHGPDGVKVFSSVCPHFGGEFDFSRASYGRLVCKWHAWAFELSDGRCASWKVKTKLRFYAHRIDEAGDSLMVEAA